MRRYVLALAFMGVLALPCSPVSAQSYSQHHPGAQVDVGIFYDSLAPHGDWVEMPDYGWSWAPRVERGWRPYTRGQWVMTDDGWFWDSDEPFGWAAYHYGRWVDDPYYGWVWVPGTEWAPAWVSWRHGNGYTGWAPLPPRATWQTHVGLNIGGLDIDAFIGARDYAFVQDRAFMDRGVYQRVMPPTQNVTIINVTNNVTNYTVVNQRVVNSGIAVADVERAVGRRVPRARTVDVARADAPRSARTNEVAVFRPEVRAAPEKRPVQGRSLVKGEAPPPLLVERRKEREQERQQKGNEPALTAKEVAQRRPAAGQPDKKQDTTAQPQTPGVDAKTQRQSNQERAKQANDANAKAQADKRATDAQRQNDQKANQQQQLDQQRAKQESDANAKAQADKRATDAQQKQIDQRQTNQQQLNEQRAKRANDANAKAQADKQARDAQQQAQKQNDQRQANQQQLNEQRAKQANDANAKAQADKRATDAQQAQKQNDQRQANQQQQLDQERAKQTNDANAKAQADKQHAKDAQQQAKDNPKGKGKKNPKASPTPPPSE